MSHPWADQQTGCLLSATNSSCLVVYCQVFTSRHTCWWWSPLPRPQWKSENVGSCIDPDQETKATHLAFPQEEVFCTANGFESSIEDPNHSKIFTLKWLHKTNCCWVESPFPSHLLNILQLNLEAKWKPVVAKWWPSFLSSEKYQHPVNSGFSTLVIMTDASPEAILGSSKTWNCIININR